MALIAITREMGSLGKDVALGVGEALGTPVVYHEIIDHLADKLRVRKSHVVRLLDGSAGLLERLTADQTSLSIFTADEIYGIAQRPGGAVIRGWGATHILREVPHALCVRVCAPFEIRKHRMMERLGTDDAERIEEEIRFNDEAHGAIMRRHFELDWTDSQHYDLALNTGRMGVAECVEQVVMLARSPRFQETDASRRKLEDLSLAARVRAALRRVPETREARVAIASDSGRITLSGAGSTDEMLAYVEVASSVPGVQDVAYRAHAAQEAVRPRFH